MVNDTTTIEYQLPGAYDYQARTSDKEDKVSLPLAIVSSVLFPSEVGIMLQTTHTSLPGAWIKDEQNNQIMTSLTTLSSSTQPQQQEEEEVSQSQKEQEELQQNQEHHKVEKQEKPTSTFNKVEYDDQVDALRQTVAELRKKAEQLEQADVMVKKGIEAVARKRVIAQHKRRRQSGWDWCDDSSISSGNNSSSNEDDDGVTPSRRPNKKKPLIFVDDEGGEWEVI
ncbi:hypothetical protein INT45_004985 [Circinella minor]|uniref:Uncharacterized protein n=1 Tax=Circinella minor TaxID=1195481 RepID=A0A8H7S7C3_9FUNG|nr:hypothetical protein INT45_004985 [Circinella minor]